ncbi:hypothetical protein Q2T40_00275 [Winogradskyella maritima]|nr:hypothetical protein [Winogradskyella maritima]
MKLKPLRKNKNRQLEEQIKEQEQQPVDDNIFQEMGDKVKPIQS